MKNSTYRNGLSIGDFVSYKNYLFGKKYTNGYSMNSIVLERIFLFEKQTRFGIKSFYEYKMLDTSPRSKKLVYKVKTQNMKVNKVITPI